MVDRLGLAAWIDDQLAGAPDALATRTREFIAEARPVDPAGLAGAAETALRRAIAASPDRLAALDLLAADALLTLALAAAAEADPEGLEAFAAAIRRRQAVGGGP